MEEGVIREFSVPKHLVTPTTQVRSTWITSSLRAMRERDLLDRYYAVLPQELHDEIRGLVAGRWLPVDFGHRPLRGV